MSSYTCKLEQDLCRCCHSEGTFKNLAEPFKTACLEEIYVDVLKECYAIDIAPIPGMLSAMTYTICEVCIIRLRDASDFKKQVLLCEERFNDIYKRNGVTDAITSIDIDVEIKEEVPDLESDDICKDDLTLDNKDDLALDDKDDFALDDKDDFALDDKDDDYEESEDLKANEEEAEEKPVQTKVTKKRKYKKRAVKTNSVKSKRKKESNLKEEPGDENDAEKKPDRSRQARFLKGVDYKKVGDIYHCARCDKKYSNIDSLRCHVRLKHKKKELRCSYCIDVFRTHHLLNIHKLEVHNDDNRITCSLCDKIFNTKTRLNIHMKKFHLLGEVGRRYKCELCDFVTISSESYYRHKINHKTERNHKCSICSKSFKRKSTLRLHEKIHTGDRSKVCTECGQAFVQKASLNYHMTKNHPEVRF